MSKKLTTEDFIRRAKQVHGDRYDYSKAFYQGAMEGIIITCKDHGDFVQTPNNHYKGKNCPKCCGSYQPTTQEFIERSKTYHGDRYDYSKAIYTGKNNKVIIICREHGEFKQKAEVHYRSGCPKCAGNQKLTTEKFIQNAIKIHGNRYDYSKVDYVGWRIPVKIICKKHGEFLQIPNNHTKGEGCYHCGIDSQIEKQSFSQEEFIKKARNVHGDIYSYDKVIYKKARVNVIITCKIHGDFKQNPDGHLRGRMCPKCKSSHGERRIRNVLNLLNVNFDEQANVGCKIKREMPFDFHIPKTKTLIEFHGEQHYIPRKFFGRTKGLRNQKFRDLVKEQWAKRNGYKLIVFSYLEKSFLEKSVMDKLKLNPQLSLFK